MNFRSIFFKWKCLHEIKKRYGSDYGFLLAFILDSTDYFSGNQHKKIEKIEISFNGGFKTVLDCVKMEETHV